MVEVLACLVQTLVHHQFWTWAAQKIVSHAKKQNLDNVLTFCASSEKACICCIAVEEAGWQNTALCQCYKEDRLAQHHL